MSALRRLKAYFGMVPADELDAAGLDPARLDPARLGAAQLDDYDPQGYAPQRGSGCDRTTANAPTANTPRNRDYAAERPGVRCSHRAAHDDYSDDLATRASRHASPRMHPTRSPAWTTEVPMRGSLAIDTAAVNTRSTAHQPAIPPRVAPVSRTGPLGEDSASATRSIITLHPYSYNEARPIGERYREGNPVIMNLTAMEDRDAKRLVDFAAGLAFAMRGSIDKITNKVFLLSPPHVDVSAEDRRRIAEGHFFN